MKMSLNFIFYYLLFIFKKFYKNGEILCNFKKKSSKIVKENSNIDFKFVELKISESQNVTFIESKDDIIY